MLVGVGKKDTVALSRRLRRTLPGEVLRSALETIPKEKPAFFHTARVGIPARWKNSRGEWGGSQQNSLPDPTGIRREKTSTSGKRDSV